MSQTRFCCGFVALAVALAWGGGLMGQDKSPVKGQLPPQWKKLGLSDEQVKKIYGVQADFRGKIAELDEKIKELKDKQRTELEKVLTDAQKARLKEILLEKAPGEKKDDKKSDKK